MQILWTEKFFKKVVELQNILNVYIMSSKIFLDNKYFVGDVKEVTEGAAWISKRRTLWQQQN